MLDEGSTEDKLFLRIARFYANDDAIRTMCTTVRRNWWRPWRWEQSDQLLTECRRLMSENTNLASEIKILMLQLGLTGE